MSILLSSRAGGLERLPYLKFCNALKRDIIFTLEGDAAKITDYIKKHFK